MNTLNKEVNGFKRCTKCKELKPALNEFFPISSGLPSGFAPWCKQCKNARERKKLIDNPEDFRAKKAEYRAHHREQIRAYNAKYLSKEGVREKRNSTRKAKHDPMKNVEYNAAYYIRNKKLIIQKQRERRAANPEKAADIQRRSWKKNPTRLRVAKQNRRARLASSEGTFTTAQWLSKVERYERRCHWCTEPIQGTPHADHLIPISKGGNNGIENIVPSCAHCNFSKSDKLPHEFMGRLL